MIRLDSKEIMENIKKQSFKKKSNKAKN